jgi:hypothetical protein
MGISYCLGTYIEKADFNSTHCSSVSFGDPLSARLKPLKLKSPHHSSVTTVTFAETFAGRVELVAT